LRPVAALLAVGVLPAAVRRLRWRVGGAARYPHAAGHPRRHARAGGLDQRHFHRLVQRAGRVLRRLHGAPAGPGPGGGTRRLRHPGRGRHHRGKGAAAAAAGSAQALTYPHPAWPDRTDGLAGPPSGDARRWRSRPLWGAADSGRSPAAPGHGIARLRVRPQGGGEGRGASGVGEAPARVPGRGRPAAWAQWRAHRPAHPVGEDWKHKARREAGLVAMLAGAGLLALLLLQVLPALLGIDGALGGQARLQALQADFLAGVDAVAVVAGLQALERAVDLADQLAVAVARAQLQRVLGLAGGTLGFVADVAHFVLEVLDGLLGLLDQVGAPLQQP